VQFTQELINEIVLWKNNKFAQFSDELLRSIENVRELHPGEHRDAESLIDSLLIAHGVGLTMVSTLLRFRNPSTFQIIDQHAYRAVYGSKFPIYASMQRKKQVGIYFDYLDELISLCSQRKLGFETIDRVLYQFDKDINGVLPKTRREREVAASGDQTDPLSQIGSVLNSVLFFWEGSMADQIRAGDLIALAAIIIGFGSTIVALRIQREVAMEEAGEPLWFPWSDWLILLAIALCVAFVISLLGKITPCRITLACAAGASAIVLEAGYIPSILAHYRIWFGKERTKRHILRERGEPAEKVLVILTGVAAVAAFVFVFCQQP
jgi:hypothetical protein